MRFDSNEKIGLGSVVACLVLIAAIFAIDIAMPLGVAGGVPYVAPLLLSLWISNRRFIWFIATLTTGLTILGFLLSPPGGLLWMVLINRLLAVFVIWITAILGQLRRHLEESLRNAHHDLEHKVQQRTQALTISNYSLLEEITERKKAEASLQDSEKRLSLALDAVGGGVFDWDAEKDIWTRTKSWYELTGFTSVELDRWEAEHGSIIHPDDVGGMDEAFQAHVRGESDRYHYEFRIRHKSSEWRWLLGRGLIVDRAEDGSPLRMVGTDTDITKRKIAEYKLQEAHDELEDRVITRTAELTEVNGRLRREIKERVRAEANLLWQGQIVERMIQGIIVTKPDDGTILSCSPQFEKMLGYEPGELLGQHISVVNASDDTTPEESAEQIMHCLNETGSWSGEVHNVMKDGTRFWCRAIVSTLDHPEYGRVWVSLHEDITARKQAEEALQRSEHKFRILTDSVPALFAYVDNEYYYRYVNKQYEEWFRMPREKIVGKYVRDIVGDAFFPSIHTQIEKALAGQQVSYETELSNHEGEVRWVNVTYVPDVVDNKVQGIFALITDRTEYRQAEEALRESEIKFRTTFESALIPITLNDVNGMFMETNAAFQELFGYSADELVKLKFTEITHPEDIEKGWNLFKQLVSGEVNNIQLEKRYFHKDGSVILAKTSASAIRDTDGRFLYLVGMIQDITASRQAENEIKQGKKRLRDILDSLFGFVGVYSLDGTLIESNEAPLKAAGLTREDVIGKPFWETYWWSYSKQVQDQLREALSKAASGETVRYDVPVRVTEDQFIDIDVTFGPLYDDEGRIVDVIGFAVDITDRKRVEKALKESEMLLEKAQGLAQIGHWKLIPATGEVTGSDELFRIFGMSNDEPTLDSFVQVVHPDDREMDVAAIQRGIDHGESWGIEHRLICGNGQEKWVHAIGEAITDQDGDVIELIGTVQDITERKRAEEAIAISEARFRGLFEAEPDGVIVVDDKGIIQLVNAKTEEMFGYSKGELVGKPIEVLVPEGLHATHLEDRDAYLASPHSRSMGVNLQVRGQRKDGSEFPADVSLSPLETDEGLFIMSIIRDITKRKHAEEALRESESKFRSLVESANAVPWKVEMKTGRFTYIGQQVEQLLGYPVSSWVDFNTWSERIYKEDREQACAYCIDASSRGEDHEFEYRAIAADGQLVWIKDVVSVITREDDTKELIGFMFNITERKEAAICLQQSEARLAEAQRTAHLGHWDWNIITNELLWSDEIYRIFGQEPQEFRATYDAFLKTVHQDDRQSVKDAVEKSLTKDLPYSIEHRIVLPDGAERFVHERGVITRDEAGQPIRMLGTVQDITERKRAEEQARQLQADLAHMSRLSTMGEMASGLAHELNQPLTVITNYANGCIRRLNSESLSQDELKEMLERISAQARRGGAIIRGLESLVRKGGVKRIPIDINESILEVLDLADVDAKRLKATTHIELQHDLPTVLADPIQIQQVVLNLVQNACEACEQVPISQRVVKVHTAWAGENELEITVSDSGPGIAKELGDQLFEPFFTTKEKGIGMGLAISRSIIEAHDGRIWLTSNPESGASFHFTLPIAKAGKSHGE